MSDKETAEGMEPEDFSKLLEGFYQGGLIMMAVSLGHDLGLIKQLSETTEPQSLEEIAGSLKLKHRYFHSLAYVHIDKEM